VEDGVPYAIDFMNPAPDADLHSVGKDNFEWIVEKVARLAVKKAGEYTGEAMSGLNWSGFLTGGGTAPAVKAPAKKVAAKKSVPQVVGKAVAKKVAAKKAAGKKTK
jgi:hypothetical protein